MSVSARTTRSSVTRAHNVDPGVTWPGKRRAKRDVHESPDNMAAMRPLQRFRTWHPRRAIRSPIEEIPTDRPLEKPADNWSPESYYVPPWTYNEKYFDDFYKANHFDFVKDYNVPPYETLKIEVPDPIMPETLDTSSYSSYSSYSSNFGLFGAVALIMLAAAKVARNKWNQTGATVGAGAAQPDLPTAMTTFGQADPGPLNNELPPSYSECSPSTAEQQASEDPPPYDNAFGSVECGAMTTSSDDTEDVSPGEQTELVFDNGRVVERRSLDLNSNNHDTGGAGDADFRDSIVYIDETPKAVIVGISYDI